MINETTLVGFISHEIEPYTHDDGGISASFDLGVRRNFKKPGTQTYEADFLPCVATKGQVGILKKHAGKGHLVGFQGSWRAKVISIEGTSKTFKEVKFYINKITLMPQPKEGDKPFLNKPTKQKQEGKETNVKTAAKNVGIGKDDDLPF